jgi:hypothetical protein
MKNATRRALYFFRRPTWPADKFIDFARPYRERFRQDGIGAFDAPSVALNPRTQGRR